MNDFWADAKVIHSYTRAQAIADGNLIEIDKELREEIGFMRPLVLSRDAWADTVTWDKENGPGQPEARERFRLRRVLIAANKEIAAVAATGKGTSDRCTFTVLRVPNTPGAKEKEPVELIVHIGGGDEGEPVWTIMTPHDQ
jgi:hypothetical protein